MADKRKRHQRIRELLARNEIRNQSQLQDLLVADGMKTTQTTLSRDLRDLGAVKGPTGYLLPDAFQRPNHHTKSLQRTLKTTLVSVDRGGNLVVLRTGAGQAQALALQINEARMPQIMAAIAGHDAVFVATRSSGQAAEASRLFKRLAGRR